MYYVYILRCKDNSLYTGYTTDVGRRFSEHCSGGGKGAKYTHSKTPVSIEAVWSSETRSEAMRLEAFIKKLTKQKKEELIADNTVLHEKYSDRLCVCEYNAEDRTAVYENKKS